VWSTALLVTVTTNTCCCSISSSEAARFQEISFPRQRSQNYVPGLPHVHRSVNEPGSSVSLVSDHGLDDRGSITDKGRGFFF
jgi:hypothetical protein